MAWCISTRGIPRIRSYEEALQYYEHITPIRGTSDTAPRPIARRGDRSKEVRLDINRNIRFRLHRTDVVVYSPDGAVAVETYDSMSTVMFAYSLLPCGIRAISHKGDMYVGDADGCYRSSTRDPLVFTKDEHDVWRVDPRNVVRYNGYALDRKRAAAVRKTIRPFRDWQDSVYRVGGFLDTSRRTNYKLLKECIDNGHIPEEEYPQIGILPFMSDLYVLGKAVTRAPLPIGSLPKETAYIDSWAWNWI